MATRIVSGALAVSLATTASAIADPVPPGFDLTTTRALTRGRSAPEGDPAHSACGFYIVGAAHALNYAELLCFPPDISNRDIYQAGAVEAEKPWIGEQIPDLGVPYAILHLYGCAFQPIVGGSR